MLLVHPVRIDSGLLRKRIRASQNTSIRSVEGKGWLKALLVKHEAELMAAYFLSPLCLRYCNGHAQLRARRF